MPKDFSADLPDPFAEDDDFPSAGAAPASVLDLWQAMEVGGVARIFGEDATFYPPPWNDHFWLDVTPGPDAGIAAGAGLSDSAPGLLAGDVIVIDELALARGGNGGGGGGGGSGGGGGDPDVLTKYVSGDPGGYNIEIVFKGTWTVALQQDFLTSADLISDIILGDVADVFFRGKIIDDITINAELKSIDGEGGILGQAGPTAIRTANYLPATAVMQFDVADAATYDALNLWDDIILHEMLHCVGFGSIWGYKGLIDGSGTATPTFTGANAMLAYEDLFNAAPDSGVPLEQDGGGGTVESHWDEETFFNELMTGYIDNPNYLSNMTIASLEDLGYDTVWSPTAAVTDPYLVT